VLQQLLDDVGPDRRRPTGGRRSLPPAGKQIFAKPLRSPGRRCRCGACPVCRENARWESIFQAKFADPTYYGMRSSNARASTASRERSFAPDICNMPTPLLEAFRR
jgi:hypothetical protein